MPQAQAPPVPSASHNFGDFFNSRLTVVFICELFFYLHCTVSRVPHWAWNPDWVVVTQKPSDFTDYHRHSVGAESYIKRRIKIVNRLDKPDYTHLKQIVGIFAPVCKSLNYGQNKPQISVNHLVSCLFLFGRRTVFDYIKQFPFFAFLEQFKLWCVYSADFNFSVLQRITPESEF